MIPNRKIYLRARRNSFLIFNNQSSCWDGITCKKTCASFLARIEHCSVRTSPWATSTCASFLASSGQKTDQKLRNIEQYFGQIDSLKKTCASFLGQIQNFQPSFLWVNWFLSLFVFDGYLLFYLGYYHFYKSS